MPALRGDDRVTWPLVEAWSVQDCRDGTRWEIRIERSPYMLSKHRRVRAVHETTGAEILSKELGARKVVAQAENITLVIGGRRLDGEWVVTGSTRDIPRWRTVPWPGPCFVQVCRPTSYTKEGHDGSERSTR